ncbi:MAG TPA: ribosome maturation factor RimP [Magnetospirillaceae bacterium]|jgi:ribosome maturation factor RimP
MSLVDRLTALTEPMLEGMGYALVRVHLSASRRPTLQVMAERRDGQPMSVEDCTAISRNLSAMLDVEDPIPDAYDLEVTSPGLDRPLVRPEDYDRFTGALAMVEVRNAEDGRRKKFKGHLLGRNADGAIRMQVDEDEVIIPLTEVSKAKLVPDDATLAAALRRH